MRPHLRAINGLDGLGQSELEALVQENRRSERRDQVVGIVGAVMVIGFVIGSWALIFAVISAVIGARGAMAISGIVSASCAVVVGALYEVLKRMVEDDATAEVSRRGVTIDSELPHFLPRTASQR